MSNSNPINDLPEQIKSYLNNKVDLISLFAIKKIGQIIPPIVVGFIVAFTFLFFTFFISYSFIQWYADYVGNASTASLIVSGFYLLTTITVFVFRKQLIYNPIQKNIISGTDFKEIHKTSNIARMESYADLNKQLETFIDKSDKDDQELSKNIESIKEYYSFDSIKSRFIDNILQNPRPAISLILQSIMTVTSFKRRRKEKKEKQD